MRQKGAGRCVLSLRRENFSRVAQVAPPLLRLDFEHCAAMVEASLRKSHAVTLGHNGTAAVSSSFASGVTAASLPGAPEPAPEGIDAAAAYALRLGAAPWLLRAGEPSGFRGDATGSLEAFGVGGLWRLGSDPGAAGKAGLLFLNDKEEEELENARSSGNSSTRSGRFRNSSSGSELQPAVTFDFATNRSAVLITVGALSSYVGTGAFHLELFKRSSAGPDCHRPSKAPRLECLPVASVMVDCRWLARASVEETHYLRHSRLDEQGVKAAAAFAAASDKEAAVKEASDKEAADKNVKPADVDAVGSDYVVVSPLKHRPAHGRLPEGLYRVVIRPAPPPGNPNRPGRKLKIMSLAVQ